jgi:hypothetical protein
MWVFSLRRTRIVLFGAMLAATVALGVWVSAPPQAPDPANKPLPVTTASFLSVAADPSPPLPNTEAATPVEQEAPIREATPLEALRYHMFEGMTEIEKQEDERWAVRNAVKAETTAESIYQLALNPFSRLFSPRLVSFAHNPPFGSSDAANEMLQEPRVAKLHQVAKNGTPKERAELFKLLLEVVDSHAQVDSEVRITDITSPHESMLGAIPFLLAEAGTPRQSLAVVSRLIDLYIGSGEHNFGWSGANDVSPYEKISWTGMGSSPLAYAMERSILRVADSRTVDVSQSPSLTRYYEIRDELRASVEAELPKLGQEDAAKFSTEPPAYGKLEDMTPQHLIQLIQGIQFETGDMTPMPYFRELEEQRFFADICLETLALLDKPRN